MSAYVSICQHTSAYVSIRQQSSRRAPLKGALSKSLQRGLKRIRQHTSAYVSIRQHASLQRGLKHLRIERKLDLSTLVLAKQVLWYE